MNGIARVSIPIAFVAAVICFLLPFFELRIDQPQGEAVTGFDLVLGNTNSTASKAHATEVAPNTVKEPEALVTSGDIAAQARQLIAQQKQQATTTPPIQEQKRSGSDPWALAALICGVIGIVAFLLIPAARTILLVIPAACGIVALLVLLKATAPVVAIGMGAWGSLIAFGIALVTTVVRVVGIRAGTGPRTASLPDGTAPFGKSASALPEEHVRPAPSANMSRPQAVLAAEPRIPVPPQRESVPEEHRVPAAEERTGPPAITSTVEPIAPTTPIPAAPPSGPVLNAPVLAAQDPEPHQHVAAPVAPAPLVSAPQTITPTPAPTANTSPVERPSAEPLPRPLQNQPKRNTMYCRNCSNEVNEKAIGCPKCGMDPRKAKNFCPSCGNATVENQVMCTKCGVALANKGLSIDTGSLPKFDASKFTGNKANIAAAVALLGCLLPWLKVDMMGMGQSANMFTLAAGSDNISSMMTLMGSGGGTILVSGLLLIFPIALIGFLAADHVPAIAKYKKQFMIASLALVVYAGIGLYQISHPSIPDTGGMGMFGDTMSKAARMAQDMISVGWGFYISLVATIAAFVLGRRA
jgi:hypothetical protein